MGSSDICVPSTLSKKMFRGIQMRHSERFEFAQQCTVKRINPFEICPVNKNWNDPADALNVFRRFPSFKNTVI